MGLRERKKARQRAAILREAVALADAAAGSGGGDGFDALRVRDLIERLEISEATFFNYYPSKRALLDAWLAEEIANAFAELPPASRSLRTLLRPRVRGLAERASGATGLAAAAWGRGRLHAAAERAATGSELAAAIERACEAGELRRDVPPAELAGLLLGAVAQAISAARADTDDDVTERALRAADLVLDGARRRHERVRLAAGSTAAGGRAARIS